MKKNRLPYYILFGLSVMLYLNTIPNRYALDDKMIIFKNNYTQKGFAGIGDILTKDAMAGMFGDNNQAVAGGRYRPLSMISFAVEQEIFGGNPHVSHFFNLLFYALSVIVLYRLLLRLCKDNNKTKWYFSIAFIASLLFAVHPLHTDAVANIKGRDEIFCFLFVLLSWDSILKYTDTKSKGHIAISFIWFLLAVFSKETAITFLFIIPVSMYFFRKPNRKQYLTSFFSIAGASIIYLITRFAVLGNTLGNEVGELMNNPFLEATTGEKYATIFMTLGIYLKLLVFPHPLTWDYYPYHIPLIEWSDWRAILPLLLYVALGVVAIVGTLRKSPYAFAVWVYLATLSITSNLFFTVGAFMSERFLYMSLLGFCLAIAYFVNTRMVKTKLLQRVAIGTLLLICLAFSGKTIIRNFDWKDNLTLFGHDVAVSVNSAKGNSSYASELYSLAETQTDTAERNKILKSAMPYFRKAIEVYPSYTEPLIRLGNCYYIMYGDYKTMFDYYLKALRADPNNTDVWGNAIGVLQNNVTDPKFEIAFWTEVSKVAPNRFESFWYMGEQYRLAENRPDSAVIYLEKANSMNPGNFDILKSLGIVYGSLNRFNLARETLLKAVSINPNDAECHRYIGVSYGIEENDSLALMHFEKAYKLNPNDVQNQNNLLIARKRLGL
ncbi:MAG TPA: DUF1736 domain-containing protein [Bacteroidales bacterium]|nr:DUF1736 domain-containing protein [Bacteroidales bacterium]